MSPEYGATVGFSPVDKATLRYLYDTGRDEAQIKLVEEYCRLQGLFLTPESPDPHYSEVWWSTWARSSPPSPARGTQRRGGTSRVSRPSRGRSIADQTRSRKVGSYSQQGQCNRLAQAGSSCQLHPGGGTGQSAEGLTDGSVIIAAITSCTNTSNPTVMIGAALLGAQRGPQGSRAETIREVQPRARVDRREGLPRGVGAPDLPRPARILPRRIRVHDVHRQQRPLSPPSREAVTEKDLYVVAALSGNRNFDGRIHPLAKGAFLMSPMLVVGYALAGNIDFDFFKQPLGVGKDDGKPVYLKDLWPSLKEIKEVAEKSLSRDLYKKRYADALVGDEKWEVLSAKSSATFPWDDSSTYVRNPPWFTSSSEGAPADPTTRTSRTRGCSALFEDKITTDHISPAGVIPADSPAGEYLLEHGVDIAHFSTYGSRRGNHEVMVRGGFATRASRTSSQTGGSGGYTKHFPNGEVSTIYDASVEIPEGRESAACHRRQAVRGGKLSRLGGKGPEAPRGQGCDRRELRANPPEQPRGDGGTPSGVRPRSRARRPSG